MTCRRRMGLSCVGRLPCSRIDFLPRPATRRHPRATPGRRLAQLFCLLLGVVGAMPFLLGLVLRTDRVRLWTERQTAAVLRQQFGIEASYRVRINLWPLQLRLEQLVVPSADGGPAALEIGEVRIAPRLFSLYAGKFDIGAVQVEKASVRLVLRDGALANVRYRLPEKKSSAKKSRWDEAPFSSIAISDARVDLNVDGRQIRTGVIDIDVTAERGPAFEISVRTAEAQVTDQRTREYSGDAPSVDAVDEDILCDFDLRARLTDTGALIRRLVIAGVTDADPKAGTRATCDRTREFEGPSALSARLSQTKIDWSKPDPVVDGQFALRLPIPLVNRFVRFLPVSGWLSLQGSATWDGTTRLPALQATLHAESLVLDRYHLGKTLDAEVRMERDAIVVPNLQLAMADGITHVQEVRIAPFEPDVPLSVGLVTVKDVQFPGLMRDLGVTEKTVVAWDFGETTVSNFHGKLAVPELEGQIHARTRDFEVFDRGFADPARRHMIGVPQGTVDGRMLVTPKALEFRDCWVTFGNSRVLTKLVGIGFSNELEIDVADQSVINLADISPITMIPISGQARLGARLRGLSSDPLLLGTLAVKDLVFGGMPVGDILGSQVKFWPLKVDLTDVRAQKGQSQFRIDAARLDFDRDASIVVDAHAKAEKLDLHDFLAMWNMADDPRYAEVLGGGSVDAKIHYAYGGHEDVCDGGILRVDGKLALNRASLFGERFDAIEGELGMVWTDRDAGFLGFSLDVPHLHLRKGPGTIIGSLQVRPGAKLNAQAVATKLPLNRFDAVQPWGGSLDAELSAVAEIGGTLDAMAGSVQASISPIRVGAATLPSSEMSVRVESEPRRLDVIGTTRCGQPITGPFDLAEYRADKSQGVYRIDGALLGGQVRLQDLTFSRQTKKHVRGRVQFNRMDLGSWIEALPADKRPEGRTQGALTGQVVIEDLPLFAPHQSKGQFVLNDLIMEYGNFAARIVPGAGPMVLEAGRIEVPGLVLLTGIGGRLNASIGIAGSIDSIARDPQLHATMQLRPVDLEPLSAMIPGVERLSGVLAGEVQLDGPLDAPHSTGVLGIQRGEVELRDFGVPITEIELKLALVGNELRIEQGKARVGSGTLEVQGNAPIAGLEIGLMRIELKARNLVLPERLGVKGLADADLQTMLDPRNSNSRPRITGQLWLDALEYNRPVTMTADVASLAQRGRRSVVENYDPADDLVDFDLQLYARRPLRIRNGLIEAELEVDKAGLQLVGTNQRFGLRGDVRAIPGGRVSMRQTVFEIREGRVTFDDAHRVLPRVDVRATTDYRRYASHASASGSSGAAASPGASGAGSVAGAAGGQWRITMHAHGDADQLRIDLTSDPALSQDDIFLLLTIGVTRAELDQAQSASVGSSVALEALGTLSGADRAVTETIPLIDDFRFGSAYSARTGRTEPTVTIGKRLADRIRASVTSGLAESREVRSNIEWRLNPKLSVEANYDNVNDISMSQLGNLGADVRWRIEFR